MSLGDAVSLAALVVLIFAVGWLLDPNLREGYRAMRAAGAPRILAVSAAVVVALFNGC